MADSWTTLPWGQGGPDGKLRPSWEAEELDQYLARKQWLRGRRPPSQDNAAFPEQPAARRGSSPGGARPSTAGPGAGTAGRPGGPPRVLLDAAGWVSKTPEAGEKQLPRRPGPGAATPRNLERIFDRVGHSGRFQLFFYFICAVQNISCGIHYFASLLMTIEPFHTCRPPGNVSQVLFNNISRKRVDDLLTLFSRGQENHITVQLQNGEVWDLSECEMSHKENKTLSSRSDKNGFRTKHPCMHGYIYDKSKWDNNVVTNWDLVCSQELLSKLIKSTFMLGIMLGAVIFGQLSDRVGRRFVLWPTSTGIFLFGVIAALSFDYYSFLMVRFLLALAVGGYHVVVFVYVMEIFGRKCRTWAAIFINSFFSLGTMIVALVGYLVRTWWLYQLILSTLTVPFVIFCWMLPETPLWLLARGKYEEAQRVVDMIASWNRKSPCRLREFLILNVSGPGGNSSNGVKTHRQLTLFINRSTGKRTLFVWLIWMTTGFGFYLASQSFINLEGNGYLNLFLSGVTDIPSYIFLYAGVYLFGRRKAMIFFLMLNALICGVTIMIPQKYHICLMVAKIVGKFAIVAVFGIVFLYTAELYPTIVRCHAMGSGTLVSFIGSMILPFVMDLSPVWIFMPQLLVGILTIVSSVVALMLPETLGKPLAATWGENDVLSVEQDRQSEKFLPTTNNIELGKVDVLHSQGPTFSE